MHHASDEPVRRPAVRYPRPHHQVEHTILFSLARQFPTFLISTNAQFVQPVSAAIPACVCVMPRAVVCLDQGSGRAEKKW